MPAQFQRSLMRRSKGKEFKYINYKSKLAECRDRKQTVSRRKGLKRWAVPPVLRLFLFLRISVVHRGSSKREEKRKRETTRLDEVLAACGIIKIQPKEGRATIGVGAKRT
ncbi:hypothetical protein PUN28_018137 [Cardiocondyla obscurior]|uniref:Uncharacterized protein n=1 Tax=Cardiocondyla obscurior TaxID=286306 RepID=A0AAW2EI48_9HYME